MSDAVVIAAVAAVALGGLFLLLSLNSSALTTALSFVTAIISIVLSLVSIVINAALLPFRVLGRLIRSLALSLATFFPYLKEPLLIAYMIVVAVIFGAAGYTALFHTGIIINAWDALVACVFRRWWEFTSKAILRNLVLIYEFLAISINTMLRYLIARGSMWFYDVADIVECVLLTGNLLRLLDILPVSWTFWYSLMFIFTHESPLSRREVFTTGIAVRGLYYPNVDDIITPPVVVDPIDGPDAKAFPGGFGAFGDATDTDTSSKTGYGVFATKNLYYDLAVIVGTTGELVADVAADLQRPAGRFMQHTIDDVNSVNSYWGRVADIATRVTSFIGFSALYGASPLPNVHPTGYQKLRHQIDKIVGKAFRIIACFIRFVVLLLVHSTTIKTPTIIPGDCGTESVFDDIDMTIKNLFQGFPVIDLFLQFGDSDEYTYNLNIFHLNWEFCRLHGIAYHQSHWANVISPPPLNNGPPGWQAHSQFCGIMTAGAVPPSGYVTDQNAVLVSQLVNDDFFNNALYGWDKICPRWDGVGIITTDERVDYVNLLFLCIKDIVFLVIDPFDEHLVANTPGGPGSPGEEKRNEFINRRNDVNLVAEAVECVIDRLINSFLYALDVAAHKTTYPFCIPAMATYVWDFSLEPCLISIMEKLLWPTPDNRDLTCPGIILSTDGETGKVLEAKRNNAFLCAIAKLSIFSGGFFRAVCDLLEKNFVIIGRVQNLVCMRKRGMPTMEEETARLRRTDSLLFQLTTQANVVAMYFASEVRGAQFAIEKCLVDDNSPLAECDSQCALTPCVAPSLDCLDDELAKLDTTGRGYFHSLVSRNSTTTRAAITLAADITDLIGGCSDSRLYTMFSAQSSLYAVGYDFFARFFTYAYNYMPAYAQCMELADKARLDGVPRAQIERDYLECIGVPIPEGAASPPSNDTQLSVVNSTAVDDFDYWRVSLSEAGIKPNEGSLCADVLHERGFQVDTNAHTGDSAIIGEVAFRGCALLHAIGARATSSGNAQHDLASFVSLTRAPLALAQATRNLDVRKAAGQFYLPESPILALPFPERTQSGPADKPHERVKLLASYIRRSIGTYGSLYAVGNYYADLNDELLENHGQHMSPEELDERETAMRRDTYNKIMQLTANTTASRERFDDALESASRGVGEEEPVVVGHHSRRGKAFANVFDALHRTISWRAQTEEGVGYDASLQRAAGGGLQHFNVRIHHEGGNEADQYHRKHAQWTAIGGRSLIALVNETAHSPTSDLSLAQSAHAALSLVGVAQNPVLYSIGKLANAGLGASRTVLSTAFRIVNRRLRLQSLPPYQAAIMALNVLSDGDEDSFRRWSRNELGYIVGEGFVSMDIYDSYMSREQTERERWMAIYTTSLNEDELNSVYLAGAEWARKYRAEQARALPRAGESMFSGIMKKHGISRNRGMRRRHTFFRRAKFLVDHGLHDDEHVHHMAPTSWRYSAAAQAANTTLERRRVMMMASGFGNQFWTDLWQSIFDAAGISISLDDLEARGEAFGMDLWERAIDEIENAETTGNDILARSECPGLGAYSKGGTDKWAIGCLPFLHERSLEFIEHFPQNPSGKGVHGFFEGPGYIEWPATMIETPCALTRLPDSQCPNPQPFVLDVFTNPDLSQRKPISDVSIDDFVCFTDYCPAVYDASVAPLCPVCDYCITGYFSAFDFGFNDGTDVLLVWMAQFRTYFRMIFSNNIEFTFFVFLFPLFALRNISPIGAGYTLLAVLAIPLGDWVFNQTPERLAFPLYPMYFWYLVHPLIGWFLFFFSITPTIVSGFNGVPYDTAAVLAKFELIYIDNLLLMLLQYIRANVPATLLDTSSLDPTIALLANNFNNAPTFEQVFYSYAAFILPVTFVLLAGLFIYIAANFLYVFGPVADFAALVPRELLSIWRTIRDFLLRRRVRNTAEELDELEDETDGDEIRNDRRLDELEEEEERDDKEDKARDAKITELLDRTERLKDE